MPEEIHLEKLNVKRPKSKMDFHALRFDELLRDFQKGRSNDISKAHRLDFNVLFYVSEGSGTHFIDFKPYRFSDGDLFFIAKNQIHYFDVESDYNGYLIMLGEDFIKENIAISKTLRNYYLLEGKGISPLIKIREAEGIAYIFEKLYEEYNSEEIFSKEQILMSWVILLLHYLERERQTSPEFGRSEKDFDKFVELKTVIENSLAETRNAKDYARKLGVSISKLGKITKTFSGKSPKQFIDEILILEIQRRLFHTDLTIQEISYELGFDEPTNLVKYFKKHTSLTPTGFKNKYPRQ